MDALFSPFGQLLLSLAGALSPQRYLSLVLTIRVLQNPENFQTLNFARVV